MSCRKLRTRVVTTELPTSPLVQRPRRHSRKRDHGTVVFLVPAAFLIVMLLGSIAADFSIALRAKHDVTDVASAAANDAATRALDVAWLESSGQLRFVSSDRLTSIVTATIDRQHLHGVKVLTVDVFDDTPPGSPEPRVAVHVTAIVDYIFAKMVPGISHGSRIDVTVRATAKISG